MPGYGRRARCSSYRRPFKRLGRYRTAKPAAIGSRRASMIEVEARFDTPQALQKKEPRETRGAFLWIMRAAINDARA